MSEQLYRSILKQMPLGYAYSRIVLDDQGAPCDFRILDVNPEFERIAGKSAPALVEKTLSQAFSMSEGDCRSWAGACERAARTEATLEFERYFSPLKCWLRLKIFSPSPGEFALCLTDVSKEKHYDQDYEDFFNVSLDLLGIADMQGNILKANAEWEFFFGFVPADLEGKNLLDFVHPEDFSATRNVILSLRKDKPVINFVNRCRRKDGTYRFIEWRARTNGEVIYGAARDITDKMEEIKIWDKLVASSQGFLKIAPEEVDYQRLVDTLLEISGARYGIFNRYHVGSTKVTTIAVSGPREEIDWAAALLGFSIEGHSWEGAKFEPLQKDDKLVVCPDLKAYTGGAMSGKILNIIVDKIPVGQVVVAKFMRGGTLFGDITLFMDRNTKFHREAYVRIYTRQVGLLLERIHSEKRIRQLLRQNETIFNGTQDALFLIEVDEDENFRYLRNNVAYEKKTGIPGEDFNGKTPEQVFGSQIGKQIEEEYHRCLQLKREISYEETLPMPVGLRTWATTLTPVFENGRPIYIVGSREDITERKKAQNQISENLQRNEKLLDLMQSRNETVDDFLRRVLSCALDFTRSRYGYLFFYDEESKRFRVNCWSDAVYEDCEIAETRSHYSLEEAGFWAEAVRRRKPVVSNHFPGLPVRRMAQPGGHVKIKRYLSVPVFDRNKVVAVLGVANKESDYTQDDVRNLNFLMNNIWAVVERKNSDQQLEKEKELFKTTLLSVGDGILATDRLSKIVVLNEVAQKLTGWGAGDAVGRNLNEVFYSIDEQTGQRRCDSVDRILETGKAAESSAQIILVAKDGTQRVVTESAAPIVDERGNITGVVLAFRDITAERQKQQSIEFLSYHDQMTGLYNRRFFDEELNRLDTRRNLPISIVMADVNGLKLTNDAFGHAAGDQLLVEAARVIRSCCRADDIIARIGGDEFVVLLPQTGNEDVEKIITRIRDLCDKTNVGSVVLSISFGWESKTDEKQDIRAVLKMAEDRMYRRKLFESPSVRGQAIQTITNMLYAANAREERHSRRVGQLCEALGKLLNISEREIRELKSAGSLHDIGKIAIDSSILNNDGQLSEQDWREIKRHPEIGYRILSSTNDLSDIAEYVLMHHERWDGAGYPKGLRGEEIRLPARIISLADAYDAMTTPRAGRGARSEKEAIEELKANAGTQFDPRLTKIFIDRVLQKQ